MASECVVVADTCFEKRGCPCVKLKKKIKKISKYFYIEKKFKKKKKNWGGGGDGKGNVAPS